MRILTAAAAVVALLMLAAGCGGDDKPKTNLDALAEVADSAPKCSEVWVVGKALPADYEGCADASGTLIFNAAFQCKDGSELSSFEDRLWVVAPAGVIADAGAEGTDDDDAYAAAYRACN